MKVFVANVSYFRQEHEKEEHNNNIKRYFVRQENDEVKEVQREEIDYELSGTVVLLTEKTEDVLSVIKDKVSDKVAGVEIVSEIDLEQDEEIKKVGEVKGKIIFQSNI